MPDVRHGAGDGAGEVTPAMTLTMFDGYRGMLRRELTLLFRRRFDWFLPLSFFFLVVLLFAIASGGNAAALQASAPAVIWSALLLAALFTHDGIFRRDYENGFIQQALLGAQPLTVFALAKITAHWLYIGAPLAALAPVAAVMLGMKAAGIVALLLALAPVTLTLSLFTVFCAALSIGQKRQLLPALLALPLLIPVLIFAVAAVDAAANAQSPRAALAFLCALAIFALTLLPIATAGAARAFGGHGG